MFNTQPRSVGGQFAGQLFDQIFGQFVGQLCFSIRKYNAQLFWYRKTAFESTELGLPNHPNWYIDKMLQQNRCPEACYGVRLEALRFRGHIPNDMLHM